MILLRTPARVLLSYAAVTLLLSWPLPVHLSTHITGFPGGDAGAYFWNPWVFHHELTAGTGFPYATDRIFAAHGGANLGLHNYTVFQNLLALPLIPAAGLTAAFNVVYLLTIVLTAWTAFLLARRVTGGTAEAWLAGLLFAWSPLMVSRGTGHYSLVAAAPIAVFLLLLLRARERPRLVEGAALGATVAWAASADAYYPIYCLMIGGLFAAASVVSIERDPDRLPRARRLLDVLTGGAALAIAAIVVSGGAQFDLLGRAVRVSSLYTPVLVLTVLVLLRIACTIRPVFAPVTAADIGGAVRVTAAAGVTAAVLMAPLLQAAAPVLLERSDAAPVYWRSSQSGANLLAFVLPSPLHPLAPDALARWFNGLPSGFIENIVSIPIVTLAVLAAAWRAGWTPPRWWPTLTALAGLLALGPFIHVGPFDTHIPGPWALLRYVPVVGLAQTPHRFAVVMLLGLSVLFAAALCWIGRTHPHRRRLLLAAVAAALVFEILPAPRLLYPVDVPRIYREVAAAPGDGRVLELPIGVRTGRSSLGDFVAASQVFQTAHGKPLVGGYISRVPPRQIERFRQDEVLRVLFRLSEGSPITPGQEAAVITNGPAFLARAGVEFVVIDRRRSPPPLADLAVRAFPLRHAGTDGDYDLYRVERGGAP